MPTAPWMQGWNNVPIKDIKKNAGKNKQDLDSDNDDLGQIQHFDGGKRKTAMHRIVDRLRNLNIIEEARKRDRDDSNSSSPEGTYLAERKIMPSSNIGTLLENKWGDMDQGIEKNGNGSLNIPLPWERNNANAKSAKPEREKRVKAPTLAELTIPDTELKGLRTLGIRLKERISVPKAGLTQNVLDKIHDQWRTSELVRLKFDEPLSENMKRAHQLSEDKTGGFVIWKAGSALVLYRGSNYEPPSVRAARAQARISSGVGILVAGNKPFVPDTKPPDPVTRRKTSNVLDRNASSRLLDPCNAASAQLGHEIISNEVQLIPSTGKLDPEKEINTILNGLGPRFIDWWGNDPLPVDADLLPEVVPNYKTPFRLLPYGTKRSKLSNSEMTNLCELAQPLPIHFALGRNMRLQGLAAAIVKLWERSEITKIAVKRGVQNTNNKLMSEEIKELTGGILLLRNKYYIIIYRGKDFLPPLVANVLEEKTAEAKVFQDEEEDARLKAAAAVQARAEIGTSIAGTLAETLEAQARWGTECEDPQKTRAAAAEARKAEAQRKFQQKIAIAQLKKQKAEKELSKLEAFLSPAEPTEDRETITNEERFMFHKLGLRMKAFLPLGRWGVFDGVIENMHLHWKHRELVKIVSKGYSFACVEDIARTLEAESGVILVRVERVSKGYAMIFYRGKNYQRPTNLRPQNLLNKRKALKRSLELQWKESLSFHIYQLEQNIKQLKLDLNKADYVDEDTHAPDSNSEQETTYSYTFIETDDEESDSEHFYSYSENEDTSSVHDSEMDAVEALQNSEPETRLQEHMSKEFDPIFSVYKKHYPPVLLDDVWRLDRIGKDGAFHKKLNSLGINTVMDFLRELNRDPQRLRLHLGNGMSIKMWDGTVEHARTCTLNNKLYLDSPPHQNNISVIFNVVYTPVAINWTDGRSIACNSISEAEKPWVEKLVRSAYQHWPNGVRELEDGLPMNNTSQLLTLQHTPVQVLEGHGNPGYQGVALLSQQDEQAAQLDVKSEMVDRQQPMKYASNDWLQPSESVNLVDSNEVAIVSGFMHQCIAPQSVESPSLALVPRQTSTYPYTLPYQQANLSSHIYRNSHRNQYPDIIKNDWASEPTEGAGGFYHSNSSNDLVNRNAENEDIQNLFRFYSGGTAEQGYNFLPNTAGDPMFNFANLPPTANFSFTMSEDRLHGKAYMGWLKLKAALKWGISVRKVVAARKARVEELED